MFVFDKGSHRLNRTLIPQSQRASSQKKRKEKARKKHLKNVQSTNIKRNAKWDNKLIFFKREEQDRYET